MISRKIKVGSENVQRIGSIFHYLHYLEDGVQRQMMVVSQMPPVALGEKL